MWQQFTNCIQPICADPPSHMYIKIDFVACNRGVGAVGLWLWSIFWYWFHEMYNSEFDGILHGGNFLIRSLTMVNGLSPRKTWKLCTLYRHTERVCVLCPYLCLTLFFFSCPNCVTPSTVSQLNTLGRYRSCAGQASSFPFRLWTVITGSWQPVRFNQSFPRWGLIWLKRDGLLLRRRRRKSKTRVSLNKSCQKFSVFYCYISKKSACFSNHSS